jgi:hypothetical protein
MKIQIIIYVSLIAFLALSILLRGRYVFKKKLNLLARNARLTSREGEKDVFPKFKLRKNWLYIKNFNPLINELHFDSKLLTSFSNFYGIKFLRATHEKKAIILKAFRGKSVSFVKEHPARLAPFHAYLGTDEDGRPFIINTIQRVSFLIGGEMGLGKSILADRLHSSLVRSSGEEKTYVFCKNKNDFTATERCLFISKDDKPNMLWHLREIQAEVIERQKYIESCGYRSGIEAGLRPIYTQRT